MLEKELGVDLFVRSRRTIQRKVELTEAGRVLLREGRQLLQLSQQAMAATQQAGLQQPIRMGVFKTLLRSRIIDIITLLADRVPQTSVKLVELPSSISVQQALLDQTIELGLTIQPLRFPGLSAIPFTTNNMAVLLPRNHPLASCEQIMLDLLQGEAWVEIPSPLNPVFETLDWLCHQAGHQRQIAQEVTSLEMLAELVQLGKGVAVIPAHFNVIQLAGVVTRPLVNSQGTPYPELELQHVVAFLSSNTSPAVRALGQQLKLLTDD